MKTRSWALVSVTVASSLAFAPAALATERVDVRQSVQQHRIRQGVARGELSARELRRLERGQQNIAREEARARADGIVTLRERERIEWLQNRAGHRITVLRNNRR